MPATGSDPWRWHTRPFVRLWLLVAALGACAAAQSQVATLTPARPWLPDLGSRLSVTEAGDFDLRRTTEAWSGRQGDTRRLAGQWLTDPAPLPWNALALSLIVKYQQNPLRASRALALLHAAMADAVLGAAALGAGDAGLAVATHAAASAVLDHLYPQEAAGRIEAIGRLAAAAAAASGHGSGHDALEGSEAAWAAGRRVAERAISRALDDGADAVWPGAPAATPGSGRWHAAPPLNLARPLEPLAGNWRTWVLSSGGEIAPPPPAAYDSAAYWREAAAVLQVSRTLSAEQKRIADEWNLDHGSVTPAGVWNQRALRLVRSHRLDTAVTAQVLAAMNVAMADAFIAAWHVKFEHWTQRPVHAIRERLVPAFLPYLLTPPFPSYVSGHATASGAAAEVLSAWFPGQRQQLIAWAEEAAQSRLYGGIHFPVDNDEGLKLGRQIGLRVLTQAAPAPSRQ